MDTYEKILHYANFNITYGDNHEPMLSYFEEIIWPAFHMDYIRGKKDEYPRYYFSDVMIKCIDDDICIVGNYIKETEYNIKTIAKDKSLVSAPSRVPSAPYSRFIIFLKNHMFQKVSMLIDLPSLIPSTAILSLLLINQ